MPADGHEGSSDRPPSPQRRAVVLSAHGDERVDEYHWLNDAQNPEVRAHLEAENAFTEAALAHLAPLRQQLFEEMLARIQEDDVSVPVRRGRWWYYQRTTAGQDYPTPCRCPARGDEPPQVAEPPSGEEVLLDLNALAAGGYLALGTLEVSPSGRWLAYSLDRQGDERFVLCFADLTGSEEAPETIEGASYGGAWADDETFFYLRLDPSMRPFQVLRHTLGQDPAGDAVVLEERDRRFHLSAHRSLDGAFVLLGAHSSMTSEVHAVPTATPASPPRPVQPRRHGVDYSVDHQPGEHGRGWFVVLTNEGGADFEVVALPDDRPTQGPRRPLVEHRPGVRVEEVEALQGRLVVGERLEGEARVRVLAWDDALAGAARGPDPGGRLVPEAETPSSTWIGAHGEFSAPAVRFEQTSLVTPRTVADLPAEGPPVVRKRQPVPGYDPSAYRTFRLWADTGDGLQVPISVVHRADLLANPKAPAGTPPAAPAPCLLYGYGAYEHSVDPAFSPLRLCLLDRGFVFAVAHVRGGGELGRRWYEEGRLSKKEHTFDDFIACARALVSAGFTSPELLAARGASAGGLLIGAVANRAPELFRALVAEVPFVDCLTTISDESLPLTVIEWEEWGNPVEDPEAYATIKAYSPYDNVRSTDDAGGALRYPDILATAGLEDQRVGFWEPAKWVARLRQANPENRVLLKTELEAGHGGPSGRYDAWREEAFVLSFVLDALGVEGALKSPGGTPS